MENAARETQSPDPMVAGTRAGDRRTRLLAPGLAAVMFLVVVVAQFGIGPTVSPGFSYLAVVLALAGIGVLLAAGLEV